MAQTPNQNVRIPPGRWAEAARRARLVHHTDRAKIINAFLVMYNGGHLDDQVSAWLATVRHAEVPAAETAGT